MSKDGETKQNKKTQNTGSSSHTCSPLARHQIQRQVVKNMYRKEFSEMPKLLFSTEDTWTRTAPGTSSVKKKRLKRMILKNDIFFKGEKKSLSSEMKLQILRKQDSLWSRCWGGGCCTLSPSSRTSLCGAAHCCWFQQGMSPGCPTL